MYIVLSSKGQVVCNIVRYDYIVYNFGGCYDLD